MDTSILWRETYRCVKKWMNETLKVIAFVWIKDLRSVNYRERQGALSGQSIVKEDVCRRER